MPRLRELYLDGEKWEGLTDVSPGDTHRLFCAIGGASQLTCLLLSGYDFLLIEEIGVDGIMAAQLQRLTALQSLELGIELVGTRDVRAIASPTQLTFTPRPSAACCRSAQPAGQPCQRPLHSKTGGPQGA